MNQRGLAPIVIVLLVAAVAIGGYLIYSGKANLNQQAPSTPTTTPASTTIQPPKQIYHYYRGFSFENS